MNPNVFDVVRCILEETGPISGLKLQRLVYYAQAWSLVWEGKPLFLERFEAVENLGPICPDLYRTHQDVFPVHVGMYVWSGTAAEFDVEQKETIHHVCRVYGWHSIQWLNDLLQSERSGVGWNVGEVVDHASLAEYYGGLREGVSWRLVEKES